MPPCLTVRDTAATALNWTVIMACRINGMIVAYLAGQVATEACPIKEELPKGKMIDASPSLEPAWLDSPDRAASSHISDILTINTDNISRGMQVVSAGQTSNPDTRNTSIVPRQSILNASGDALSTAACVARNMDSATHRSRSCGHLAAALACN